MTIAYKLVYGLINNKKIALLAMFLLAIAPLSITVTHFATGDIGVDLFTAFCFLFLLFYLDKNQKKEAKGPDSFFWNTIQVAPLPQIPNPIGRSWIFLNGPSFPRNERMFRIHGWKNGITVKRYIVLPAGNNLPLFTAVRL